MSTGRLRLNMSKPEPLTHQHLALHSSQLMATLSFHSLRTRALAPSGLARSLSLSGGPAASPSRTRPELCCSAPQPSLIDHCSSPPHPGLPDSVFTPCICLSVWRSIHPPLAARGTHLNAESDHIPPLLNHLTQTRAQVPAVVGTPRHCLLSPTPC